MMMKMMMMVMILTIIFILPSPCLSIGHIHSVGTWRTAFPPPCCGSPNSTSLESQKREATHKFKTLQEDLTELSLELHEKKSFKNYILFKKDLLHY